MNGRLDSLKEKYAMHIEQKEKQPFGVGDTPYPDVEADEVDLGMVDTEPNNKDPKKRTVAWEQWMGIVQRGHPRTLRLHRLFFCCPGD